MFTAEALSEVTQSEAGRRRVDELKGSGQSVAGQSGVNQVLMIQVPLKVPERRMRGIYAQLESLGVADSTRRSFSMGSATSLRGLDTAVVDVASFSSGKFIELDGKGSRLERNPNLPIRVDVVRYLASDRTDLNSNEVAQLPEELRGIYAAGRNLGSLVTADTHTRITRNYQPWTQSWWHVVLPYLPAAYLSEPWKFFQPIYGPGWVYRFPTEEMARRTLSKLEEDKAHPFEQASAE